MIADLLLSILICTVFIPVAFLFLEIVFSFRSGNNNHEYPGDATIRPAIAVLIPAHNEESVIKETLQHVNNQLHEGDCLIVVADNCIDETANIARTSGATVIERTDALNKGKGFALEYGIRYLEKSPPDVVIIIDADCVAGRSMIDELSKVSLSENRPVQALYTMQYKGEVLTLSRRVASFAWKLKNHIRPLGLKHMGLPCQLMGSGMAFPFKLLSSLDIGTSNIVEDMQLGIDLAKKDAPPFFFPDVTVSSSFPCEIDAEKSQRTRWVHGHIGTILDQFPSVMASSCLKRDYRLSGLALDLLIPPITLLSLLVIIQFVLTFGVTLVFNSNVALSLSIITVMLFFISIVIVWAGYGRDIISVKDILTLPLYAIGKIPLYIRFFTKRETNWTKTKRD